MERNTSRPMTVKDFFKKLFVTASLYFMVITAAYTAITVIVNVSEGEIYLRAAQLLFHVIFSLLASAAWQIFRLPKPSTAVRLLAHYAILLFAFYLCFLVPASMRAPQIVIGILFFTLIYAIIMAISAFFLSRLRTNREKQETYQKQFQSKKK